MGDTGYESKKVTVNSKNMKKKMYRIGKIPNRKKVIDKKIVY